jgi:PAS domain S-box-containing protein
MNLYEVIYQSATESLIISNREGIIEQANPASEELFGYKKEELIGQKVDILIPKNHSPQTRNTERATIRAQINVKWVRVEICMVNEKMVV